MHAVDAPRERKRKEIKEGNFVQVKGGENVDTSSGVLKKGA